MSKMQPLEISLLNEGNFVEEIDEEFRDLQAKALAYAKLHKDDAKGSKSKLTVEIELRCEEPKTEFFSIKTQLKKTLPAPPARVTSGIGDHTQTGELALFVRESGSSYDTPEQHLITDEKV